MNTPTDIPSLAAQFRDLHGEETKSLVARLSRLHREHPNDPLFATSDVFAALSVARKETYYTQFMAGALNGALGSLAQDCMWTALSNIVAKAYREADHAARLRAFAANAELDAECETEPISKATEIDGTESSDGEYPLAPAALAELWSSLSNGPYPRVEEEETGRTDWRDGTGTRHRTENVRPDLQFHTEAMEVIVEIKIINGRWNGDPRNPQQPYAYRALARQRQQRRKLPHRSLVTLTTRPAHACAEFVGVTWEALARELRKAMHPLDEFIHNRAYSGLFDLILAIERHHLGADASAFNTPDEDGDNAPQNVPDLAPAKRALDYILTLMPETSDPTMTTDASALLYAQHHHDLERARERWVQFSSQRREQCRTKLLESHNALKKIELTWANGDGAWLCYEQARAYARRRAQQRSDRALKRLDGFQFGFATNESRSPDAPEMKFRGYVYFRCNQQTYNALTSDAAVLALIGDRTYGRSSPYLWVECFALNIDAPAESQIRAVCELPALFESMDETFAAAYAKHYELKDHA